MHARPGRPVLPTCNRSASAASTLALATSVLLAAMAGALSACEGCHLPPAPTAGRSSPDAHTGPDVGPSTFRFYVASDLAGALEPCGCVKDQLGGVEHAAAFIAAEKSKSAAQALVTAGPLFFMDAMLDDERRLQETAKAETLAASLRAIGFRAFAPARNDWAGGPGVLSDLVKTSGGDLLFANGHADAQVNPSPFPPPAAKGEPVPAQWVVKPMNGVNVALIGVSSPDADASSTPIPGIKVTAPVDAVREAQRQAKAAGATVFIVLASVGRGEAKRIAEANPDLTAVVVGSPGRGGDVNTSSPPPEQVGNVLVAETGNHLQTLGVLDFFVRDGSFRFSDGTGLSEARHRSDLSRRIQDLRGRIAQWQSDTHVDKKDIDARIADVAKLEAERAALDGKAAPAQGSFFRYTAVDVRDSLGTEPGVAALFLAYYKRVNDGNRLAFASRTPRAPSKDEAGYVGIATCSGCHPGAKAFWDKTRHAGAYATLSRQFKEFNLDCVGCHVTGYERPGGSTVTHVDGLRDVQCEVCHGPGSKHVASGGNKAFIVAKPAPATCESCHHPPHVHEFNSAQKMAEILGPGHGQPP